MPVEAFLPPSWFIYSALPNSRKVKSPHPTHLRHVTTGVVITSLADSTPLKMSCSLISLAFYCAVVVL